MTRCWTCKHCLENGETLFCAIDHAAVDPTEPDPPETWCDFYEADTEVLL